VQQTMWRQGKKTISRLVSKQMQHSRRSSSKASFPDGGFVTVAVGAEAGALGGPAAGDFDAGDSPAAGGWD
jgi:hypothetical protein